MQSDAARLGVTLAALGTLLAVVAAALAGIGAAWWVWTGYLIWGALWVTAALGLGDAASRKFLCKTLDEATYTQIYTTLTRRLLTPFWTRLCDPAPDKAPWPTQFRAALTWRLYDRALLIAVAYPILLLVGQWVWTGDEGRVGSYVVLPRASFWPDRATFLAVFCIVISLSLAFFLRLAFIRKTIEQLLNDIPNELLAPFGVAVALPAAVAVSVVTAVALAAAFSGNLAITSALAIFIACAFSFGLSLVGTGIVAGSIAISGALALGGIGAVAGIGLLTILTAGLIAGAIASVAVYNHLQSSYRPSATRLAVTWATMIIVPVLMVTLDWSAIPEDRRSLFLFLAVLPLLNALFDVISYAATLSLTRRGLQSPLPLLWGLADLALACALFLALGTTLVAAIHALNLLAGVPFLDLPALFYGIRDTPGAYFWLYAMLFSTILPTALHAALSLLGLQGIWPRPLRRHVATWIDSATTSPLASFRASLALGMIWTLPVLALMLIAAALWWGLGDAIRWTLAHYLDALRWIATHPLNAL